MPNPKFILAVLFLLPALVACEDARDYDLSTGPEIQLLEATSEFVRVGWGDIFPDARKFHIERKKKVQDDHDDYGDRKFRTLEELPPEAREYTDTDLKDRTFKYRLRAFFKNGRTARSVILEVEVPDPPAPLVLAPDRRGEVSPNGRFLARIFGDRLIVTDLASGARTPATAGDLGPESGFCWMPDSRHLAIVAGDSGGEDLHLTDFPTGESRALTLAGVGAADPEVSPDGAFLTFRRDDGIHRLPLEGLIEPEPMFGPRNTRR
jgi:hypothetical protein